MQKARIWSATYPVYIPGAVEYPEPPSKRFWHVQGADWHGPLTLLSFQQCISALFVSEANKAFDQAMMPYSYEWRKNG